MLHKVQKTKIYNTYSVSSITKQFITIKCIYTNYVVNIRHIRHQIDKLCGGLPPVSVYGSGVAQIIVSSITGSEFTSLP